MTQAENPAVPGNIELQMRQTYANIARGLAQYGGTMENLVEEMIFVTVMDAALPKFDRNIGWGMAHL